jgi:hypothetical protein
MRWMSFLLCLLAGLATAASATAQAPGGPAPIPCHDYQKIAETLGKRYGEAPVSLGLQTNGHVLQVFSSAAIGGSDRLSQRSCPAHASPAGWRIVRSDRRKRRWPVP